LSTILGKLLSFSFKIKNYIYEKWVVGVTKFS